MFRLLILLVLIKCAFCLDGSTAIADERIESNHTQEDASSVTASWSDSTLDVFTRNKRRPRRFNYTGFISTWSVDFTHSTLFNYTEWVRTWSATKSTRKTTTTTSRPRTTTRPKTTSYYTRTTRSRTTTPDDSYDQDPNDRDPNDRDPNDRDPNDIDPNDRDPNDGDPDHRDPNDRDPNDKDPNNKDPNDNNPDNYPDQDGEADDGDDGDDREVKQDSDGDGKERGDDGEGGGGHSDQEGKKTTTTTTRRPTTTRSTTPTTTPVPIWTTECGNGFTLMERGKRLGPAGFTLSCESKVLEHSQLPAMAALVVNTVWTSDQPKTQLGHTYRPLIRYQHIYTLFRNHYRFEGFRTDRFDAPKPEMSDQQTKLDPQWIRMLRIEAKDVFLPLKVNLENKNYNDIIPIKGLANRHIEIMLKKSAIEKHFKDTQNPWAMYEVNCGNGLYEYHAGSKSAASDTFCNATYEARYKHSWGVTLEVNRYLRGEPLARYYCVLNERNNFYHCYENWEDTATGISEWCFHYLEFDRQYNLWTCDIGAFPQKDAPLFGIMVSRAEFDATKPKDSLKKMMLSRVTPSAAPAPAPALPPAAALAPAALLALARARRH